MFHTSLPVLHVFPSYCTSSLLSLAFFFLLLLLWFALCAQAPAPSRSSKAWAPQDNATLRQSDRKRLKSFFSGHWGDFKAVSQKQADVVAVFHSLLHWHEHTHTHRSICTHTDTHMPTQRSSHTWHTVTHIGCHAAHSERENVR